MRRIEPVDINTLRSFSPKEFEIMNYFWNTEASLSRSELMELGEGLNRNTLNILVPRLIRDGFLTTAKFVQTKTVLARAYRPTVSRSAYLAKELGFADAGQFLLHTMEEVLAEDTPEELLSALRERLER